MTQSDAEVHIVDSGIRGDIEIDLITTDQCAPRLRVGGRWSQAKHFEGLSKRSISRQSMAEIAAEEKLVEGFSLITFCKGTG